jgi:hypothetical protein
MAVNLRQLFPLQQAKERRIELGRYLRLDGGRYLIAAAFVLSLISLISLNQTGRLAAIGYEITTLRDQKTMLLRDQNRLLLRLSQAQSLDAIEQRAVNLKLRELTPAQQRYIVVDRPVDPIPAQPAQP